MGILYQIISMTSYGASNCFWPKPLKYVKPIQLIAIRSFFTSGFFLILNLSFEVYSPGLGFISLSNVGLKDILFAVFLCFVNFWGLFFFLKSMQRTDARISISIGSAGTLITLLISIFLYHETPGLPGWINFGVFILGCWFIEDLRQDVWVLKWSSGVIYAILCMVFWETGGLFPLVLHKIGFWWFSFILEITVFLSSSAIYIFFERKTFWNSEVIKTNGRNLLFLILFGLGGVFFFNLAMQSSQLYLFALIGMLQPLTSIIIGSFMFETKLSFYQRVGVGILLSGMFFQILQELR